MPPPKERTKVSDRFDSRQAHFDNLTYNILRVLSWLVLAAPLDFPRRGKSRLEFLLALTDILIAGEPWPLA